MVKAILSASVAALAILGAMPARPDRPAVTDTFEVVARGMKCGSQSSGQMDCTYSVGADLRFVIAAVGEADAGYTVEKVNGYAGDYYATFGWKHGCIIVKPGAKTNAAAGMTLPTFAFVSPINGKVYHSWQECSDPK